MEGVFMNKDKRESIVAAASNSGDNSNSSLNQFQYKPPNNSGTILGIIGGALSAAGDALATIGAIIQLNIDTSTDFQSQVESHQSDQDKNKMQEEIDDLQEKVKQLEELIKNSSERGKSKSIKEKRNR